MGLDLAVSGDKVFVEAEPEVFSEILETKHEVQMLYQRGIVQGVGEGRITKKGVRIPVPCKPGDRVIFKGERGQFFGLGGKVFLFLPASDLLAIQED
jgi:co-chaperonin GroES (HSP10)